jgi:lipopolysaccharide/colanic/teichoic acid biosynthesis glycosyltransferase
MAIRFLDVVFSVLGLAFGLPLMLLLYIMLRSESSSPIYCQERVGKHKKKFTLYKFRTMRLGAKSLPTHEAEVSDITTIGITLRRTKLDEIPQLWNVLKGDMSLVGPRPGLFNHQQLITAREELGLYNIKPGITGLSQIKKIDMSTPNLLAKTDAEMMRSMSVKNYFYYVLLTIIGSRSGAARD